MFLRVYASSMAKPDDAQLLEIEGREVRVSNPGKLYFTRVFNVRKMVVLV